MRLRTLIAGFLFVAVSTFAAAVDGKWSGSISTPGGDFAVAFTFKADGAKLTGTMQGMDGMDIKISDGGKVDGDKITFSITLDFGGMPFTLNYTGLVSNDQIKLTADVGGMPLEFVVKKAQ
jgi:hypothetical protein